jgi:hypothetical protein
LDSVVGGLFVICVGTGLSLIFVKSFSVIPPLDVVELSTLSFVPISCLGITGILGTFGIEGTLGIFGIFGILLGLGIFCVLGISGMPWGIEGIPIPRCITVEVVRGSCVITGVTGTCGTLGIKGTCGIFVMVLTTLGCSFCIIFVIPLAVRLTILSLAL